MNRMIMALLAMVIVAGVTFVLYSKWEREKKRADNAERHLIAANKRVELSEKRLKEAAIIDMKYTTELRDAKNSIQDLRQRVESGDQRLRLAATCSQSASGHQRASSMDDAATPRLSRDAQQAYFTLREQIASTQKTILGLQHYIRQQCVR